MPNRSFGYKLTGAIISLLLLLVLYSQNYVAAANPPIHQQTVSATGYNVTSLTTATVQGGTNQLYLVSVTSHKNINVTQVTGLGLVWSEIKSQCGGTNQNGTEIWQAFGSPASGTVTVTFSAKASSAVASVSRYLGADPVNPTTGVMGENTNGPNGACSGGTINKNAKLTLTSNQNNAVLYTSTSTRNKTISGADPDYTQRANNLATNPSGAKSRLYIHDRIKATAGPDTLNHTLSGTADWVTAGVVINPVGTLPSPTPTPVPTPTPLPSTSPSPSPPLIGSPVRTYEIPIKVLLIIYDPILENYEGVKLHEYFTPANYGFYWQDPYELANQLVNDFAIISHENVKYEIVEIIERDEWPLHLNGQRYTDDLYIQEALARNWTLGPGNYNAIINDNNIEQSVNDGKVDEVWLAGAPGFGWWETAMAGNGAYYINGDPIYGVNSKAFVFGGFNYERTADLAIHAQGHKTEDIIKKVYGSWEQEDTHDWNKYTQQDFYLPGKGGIGSVHYAFNAVQPNIDDYDYYSNIYKPTSVKDWQNFPDMTGDTTQENCTLWGCNHDGYIKFWFDHMPQMAGVKEGILNNWWRYIADVDQYKTRNKFYNPTVASAELTENNAADWSCWAESASCSVSNDSFRVHDGSASLWFVTDGGYDTYVAYPNTGNANWNLQGHSLVFWAYAQNATPYKFQHSSPWIILKNSDGSYFRYQNTKLELQDVMNLALDRWKKFTIPLYGDSVWKRTVVGSPTLSDIDQIEIHADTWDAGFIIYFDGLHFETIDQTLPIVSVTEPAGSSIVSGIVPIKVEATDDSVVNRVDYYIDNIYFGTDAIAPYIYFWNTAINGPGSHTIRVRAVDFVGHETVSETVTVNVGTPPSPSPIPSPTPTPTPTPSPSPTANLILNPGFELDTNGDGKPDNWSVNANFSRSNLSVHSGLYSGRHFATSNPSYAVNQIVTGIVAGTNYKFEGWVNIPSTSDGFTFKIQFTWKKSGGANISTKVVKTYSASTAGWNLASVTAVAPPQAAKANIQMKVSSLNASIYIDDFLFQPL